MTTDRALVAPIERDGTMERDYIPLPGGWELQTKGKGSTFRLCGPDDERLPIPDSPYLHETLTQMARDIHAAALALPIPQPDSAAVVKAGEGMGLTTGCVLADWLDSVLTLEQVTGGPNIRRDEANKAATAASLREHAAQLAAKDKTIAALQKDAARLDWLESRRENYGYGYSWSVAGNGSLRSVIDAAHTQDPQP